MLINISLSIHLINSCEVNDEDEMSGGVAAIR